MARGRKESGSRNLGFFLPSDGFDNRTTFSPLSCSVQILNERNEIFTIEEDPYMGLSVLSCVREEESEGGKKAVIQVRKMPS